jgi:hypothetical protein|tara:strand:+ start:492 stop:800 length:309 start_codon:yes stop_codon:yes gene_type:complete
MAGGGSFASDQKFTKATADGQLKTASGGSTNIGPCRITYIQATGFTNIKLYDAATASGAIIFESTFGSEGLDMFIPGSGIRFRNTVFIDVTGSGSVTIGYTG